LSWWRRQPTDRDILVSPSLLAADFSDLKGEISAIESAGADLVHLDVMDGHFVPNLTFGAVLLEGVRKLTTLPLDAHLMVEHPESYIAEFAEKGADLITIHAESSSDIARDLALIKTAGKRCGLTLNPDTPMEKVEPFLKAIDLLLVMSVHPGYCGQSFIESALDKVKQAKDIRERSRFDFALQIDGGINTETAKRAVAAGVDILVAGSFIFGSDDYGQAIQSLKHSA
jgi:ribulose-phosphate 3-epimerase